MHIMYSPDFCEQSVASLDAAAPFGLLEIRVFISENTVHFVGVENLNRFSDAKRRYSTCRPMLYN